MDGGGGGGARRRKTESRDRHIPPEITEAILLNLPVKSLLRFSSVSKLWNSIIFGPWFVKKYRGTENLVRFQHSAEVSSLTQIPSVPSDNHSTTTTTLNCPIAGKPHLLAFCDELLCVKVETSLFLWNPCIRTYRRLCDPPLLRYCDFLYGLGYDAVGDDYKMLRIGMGRNGAGEAELYSLRSDSWKKIQHFPQTPLSCHHNCSLTQYSCTGLLVNGTLHWLVFQTRISHSQIIISFDLSTEKYGEMATPEHSDFHAVDQDLVYRIVTPTLSRGKLCMCVDYYDNRRLVMWRMENYGVAESWSTTFDISYDHGPFRAIPSTLTHLKFYDEGPILIKPLGGDSGALILLHEEKYGEIVMSEHSHEDLPDRLETLTVSRGKLCMWADYFNIFGQRKPRQKLFLKGKS